ILQVSSNPVSFTGQGMVTLNGVVYVPNADVSIVGQDAVVTIAAGSGTATSPPILGALIAFDLKVDGNGVLVIDPDDPTADPLPPSGGAAGAPGTHGLPGQVSVLSSGVQQVAVRVLGSGESTTVAHQTALDQLFTSNLGGTRAALSGESEGGQFHRSLATWI